MKILKSILLASVCALYGIYGVSADELTECMASSQSTCTLTGDLTLSDSITVSGSKAIDLNGYTVTASLSEPLFNVGAGASLSVSGAISITNRGVVFNVTGGTLNLASGTYYSQNNAVVLETAGAVSVSQATVTGQTGIEVQGGSLYTSGGNYTSNATGVDRNASAAYNVVTGAGIVAVKGKTSTPINVTLNAGTYAGKYAFYEYNLGTGSNIVSVTINGGSYNTLSGFSSVKADSITKFIYGGEFGIPRAAEFDTYLADNTELSGNIVISKNYTITARSAVNGSVTTNVSTSASGATVTITATPDTGYVLDSLKVYKVLDDSEVSVYNRTFTMPQGNVYVVATFKEQTTSSGTISKNVVINTTETDENNSFGVESSIIADLIYRNAIIDIIRNNNLINDVEVTINTNDIANIAATSYPDAVSKISSYALGINDTAQVAKYYQISMSLSNEGLRSGIENKNIELDYKIVIPGEFRGITRNYYIIGYNGSNAYSINGVLDSSGEFITFANSKNDIFALAYADGIGKPAAPSNPVVEPVDNNPSNPNANSVPNTYDGIYNYFIMNGLSVLGLIIVGITYKKKYR